MECAGGKCSSGPVPVLGAMPLAEVRPSAPQTLPLFRSSFKDKRFFADARNAAQDRGLAADNAWRKCRRSKDWAWMQHGEEACNVES